jgi:hypothetical protein
MTYRKIISGQIGKTLHRPKLNPYSEIAQRSPEVHRRQTSALSKTREPNREGRAAPPCSTTSCASLILCRLCLPCIVLTCVSTFCHLFSIMHFALLPTDLKFEPPFVKSDCAGRKIKLAATCPFSEQSESQHVCRAQKRCV